MTATVVAPAAVVGATVVAAADVVTATSHSNAYAFASGSAMGDAFMN